MLSVNDEYKYASGCVHILLLHVYSKTRVSTGIFLFLIFGPNIDCGYSIYCMGKFT